MSLAIASPIDINIKPDIAALNIYLYGHPNPEWLEYLDEDGKINHSLIHPPKTVEVPIEPFYNALTSVKFYIYTRKEPNRQQVLLENMESIKSSTFNRKKPLRFIVHGWQNSEKSDSIQLIKNAYLKKGDYNIFSVDWGDGASSLNYYTSRHRIGDVANVLSRFIEFIVKELKIKTNNIQLIGHSLGAHICGLTAKELQVGRIPVIVGLDPASPLFTIKNRKNRLDIDDAEYVEIVHTATTFLGFHVNIGTADFYPNYGKYQPGCGLDIIGICAHSRAYEYFAESVNSNLGFWSRQCDNYMEIVQENCTSTQISAALGGDPIEIRRADGIYHLETNKDQPYAKGN